MKFHHNLLIALEQILSVILHEGYYADKVIENQFKLNKKWGARDRAFVAESCYDIIRYLRYFSYLVEDDQNLKEIISMYFFIRKQEEIPFPEYKIANHKNLQHKIDKAKRIRAIQQSYPDWIDRLAEHELGAQWESEAAALNIPAELIIRANTLKTSATQLQLLLKQEGMDSELISQCPDALSLNKRHNVFRSIHFKNGLFEIQDAASQCVAPFLEADPGMRVIDACAGAGGKSLHLASLMKNKGRIISLDTDKKKLDELLRRCRRNGVFCVETKTIDSSKTIKRLANTADRLLLDVPCSGTGVLKRNPDTKWKLSEEQLEEIKLTQQQILDQYGSMLRTNGKMVYATCSILPSENQGQVSSFLERQNGRFVLEEEMTLLPSVFGYDGFYMARLIKKA